MWSGVDWKPLYLASEDGFKGFMLQKNRESSARLWWYCSQLPANINVDQLKQRHFNHIETFLRLGVENLRICFQLDTHISIRLLSKKNKFTQFPFSINQILEEKPHCFSSSELMCVLFDSVH